MYISPQEYAQFAALSGRIVEHAGRLLDMAEQVPDDQTAMALVERAREFMAISGDMFTKLDGIAKSNAPRERGLFDRDPALRQVIEDIRRELAKVPA